MTIRDNQALVAALLGVDGVAGASIEAAGPGPGTLRLQLAAGTDQVIVAGAVNRLLRARFGLAVDPDRVRVLDEAYSPLTVLPGFPAVEPPNVGKHAAADRAADRAADSASDSEPNGTDPAGDALAPAVGAYARDAVDVSTIITTDLRSANGADHPDAPVVSLARPSRLTIERVQLVSAGLAATVSVTLGLDGHGFEGAAEGAATQTGLLRSVARATLRAVEKLTDEAVRFEIEHVEVTRTGTDQTALVVITMLTGRSSQRLSGASVVRKDIREAVIRAVLAALNRRMEPLLAER